MSLTHTLDGRERTFSEVLERLREGGPSLALQEVVDAFGERGIGALILVLSTMSLLPWPPGSKSIFSVPIILLASELALQREEVWLPRWFLNRSLSREAYRKGVGKVLKPIRFIENLTRPRLLLMTGTVSKTLIGIACILLAIMMALPVPFGDMLPGATLVLFALGVMQRDGVAAGLGWFGTVVCGGYLALVWTTVLTVGERLIGWLQGVL